jgi:ribosomal protein S15P/S13E
MVESRLKEMSERRRRLLKYMFKKEGRLDQFEDMFKESI